MSPGGLVVRRARVDEIFPLRHAVLRPGKPVTYSVYGEDDGAVHIGAWDDGELVGCATVFPDPWAGAPEWAAEPAAWRLRGMAVDPSRQGQGVGGVVLGQAVEAAREAAAPMLWANARTAALRFYERHGWRPVGEEFLTADTGLPHVAIVLPLPAPPAPIMQ
ncbi:MAG: GNAT family N-acetyltransferase [Frankiaceae bacterium]|nr:GNAT family N-acetyltransferase [Frankiaceae bacterium]